MKKILFSYLVFQLFGACKLLPQNIRSSSTGSAVYGLIDQGSIKFNRNATGSGGQLNFQMKGRHNCRVEYWSENPNGRPAAGSPMTVACPNDGKADAIALNIEGLDRSSNMVFRITLWPSTLNALSGFPIEFRENQDLSQYQANHLVVARYVSPRNTAEIYTFQFGRNTNLTEIKTQVVGKIKGGEIGKCMESEPTSQAIFIRNQSLEDGQKRPLHGLTEVSSDGFGRANAQAHPFYPTRLMQFYDAVERQQNWNWSFRWENQPYKLEGFPPGYLATLSIGSGGTPIVLKNRQLSTIIPEVEMDATSPRITPSILYPNELSRYELVIKTANGAKTLLRCVYDIDQETVIIPDAYYQKIAAGEYLATFMFETNQLLYKEGGALPPWLVSSQDWIQFRINKKM